MSLDSETRGIIDDLLSANKVVLFMKGTPDQPQCGFSAKTTAALDLLIPDFATVNVLEHPAIREGIKEYANWPTIPQLYINGELIGGSDIVLDMMQSGELAEALDIEKPTVTDPKITISDGGLAAINKALASQPGGVLQLQISATWTHQISLTEKQADAVHVDVAGIEFQMDPWTAARADGLNLILEEDLAGTHFVFDNPNAPPPIKKMSVQQLKERLGAGEDVLLIDVRPDNGEPADIIEGAQQWNEELRQKVETLPKNTEIIIYCQVGGRSMALAEALRRRGYSNLHNVTGGITAWLEDYG